MKFCLLEELKLKRKPTEEERYIDVAINGMIGRINMGGVGYLRTLEPKCPQLTKELNKWWKEEGKIKYAQHIKQANKLRKEYEEEYEFDELTGREVKILREMIKEYKKRR